MDWLKKKLFLLIAILLVYTTYFFFHAHVVPEQKTLGVSTNLVLFEQPKDGIEPILTALHNAIKQIDVEVYLLSDKEVISALMDACHRGVAVRVMLEKNPFGGGNINEKTASELQSSCVHFQWANPSFALTHEKSIIIDSSIVFILTQNLTSSSFTKNREYDIEDGNAADVAEIEKIFSADWNRSLFQQTDNDLVISPLSSRSMLTSLISGASREIDIEMEVVDDPMIANVLSEKAKQTMIRLLLPSLAKVSSNKLVAKKLQQAGVHVKFLDNPYLHAKLILFDNVKVYIGSVNLTTQSMDENREVGIILSQKDILEKLQQDFLSDWDMTQSYLN